MKVVVDASVGIKWVIRNPDIEPNVDRALVLLRGIRTNAVKMIIPPHFKAEVFAVVARARPQMLPLMFGILSSIAIEVVETEAVYRRACKLSVGLQLHLFDTLYHAVALETDATFLTADDRYFSKASPRGGIQHLSAFTLGA